MMSGFCPMWATGSTGTMAKFPVLDGIECLTILADNDENERGRKGGDRGRPSDGAQLGAKSTFSNRSSQATSMTSCGGRDERVGSPEDFARKHLREVPLPDDPRR